jgi:predicted ABC-type ATPase
MRSSRTAKPGQPTVVVIAGPNGAGKSTAAPFLLKHALGILEFVNADQIATGLSAYSPETVSFEAGRIMLKRLRELAVNRVALRVKQGGHNIPQADVERRFQRSLKNLYGLYLPLADRWTVLDNAMGTLKPIAHGTARRTYVEEPEKWLNLKRLAQ